jgi:hypothetical protein
MTKQAKPDFFDLYLDYRSETEPPTIFNRWAAIAVVSAWLGRRIWFPFGSNRIFPNQYVMFVGDPGSRKSTAIKNAVKIIREAGYTTLSAQKTSKEKWLLDLAGEDIAGSVVMPNKRASGYDPLDDITALEGLMDNTAPHEMLIPADEFNNFIGNGNLEFLSLLGELWDWDDEVGGYEYRLKNSKSIKIFQPTITILAGNTPTGFAECFPPAAIGQGFMSRLVLIHGESSGRKITIPPVPAQSDTDKLVALLLQMRQKYNGPATITADAMSALDLIYKTWPDLDDPRFKHYSTRRFTHLIKLCILHMVSRLGDTISIDDVIKSNTVLAHAETLMPKALGELGKARTSEAANKIMQMLYAAKEPITMKQLMKAVHQDLDKIADIHPIIQTLIGVEKIQIVPLDNGQQAYLPKVNIVSRKLMYINMKLLEGREI